MLPKVKVCGLTDVNNALEVVRLGVSYAGCIVNYPASPRSVSLNQAVKVLGAIKKYDASIKTVAVMVDPSEDDVEQVIKTDVADIIQLHGSETPEFCADVQKKISVWKALVVTSEKDIESADLYRPHVSAVLFDAGKGSGELIPLALLEGKQVDVLAGGLGSGTVFERVERVRPSIIDLNSKVESKPGIKDMSKIKLVYKELGIM